MKIKTKTLKSAKKRFIINKNKIIKHKSSNTRHLLINKSNKRKRHLRKLIKISCKNIKKICKMINI